MRSEAEIIERIWRRLPSRPTKASQEWLLVGVGDDAALLRGSGPGGIRTRGAGDWVLSSDSFLEGVHFLADVHPTRAVGYKALARATSDLAAMGAQPRFFMLNLALPASRTGRWMDGLLAGMASAARRFGMVLIGGDTSQYPSIVMSITVGGVADVGHILTRSGARPGDGIYVSGTLGAAQCGLELFLRSRSAKRNATFVRPHLYPRIPIELGRRLTGTDARARIASAAIDTSDGLSTDLSHICRASGVCARIFAEKIPCVNLPPRLQYGGFDPLKLALHGGEDYQILFTAKGPVESRDAGLKVTRIGEILPRRHGECRGALIEIVHRSGRTARLAPRGWDSFRKKQ